MGQARIIAPVLPLGVLGENKLKAFAYFLYRGWGLQIAPINGQIHVLWPHKGYITTLSRNPYSLITHSFGGPRSTMGYDRVDCRMKTDYTSDVAWEIDRPIGLAWHWDSHIFRAHGLCPMRAL